jgi:hypothetical protein
MTLDEFVAVSGCGEKTVSTGDTFTMEGLDYTATQASRDGNTVVVDLTATNNGDTERSVAISGGNAGGNRTHRNRPRTRTAERAGFHALSRAKPRPGSGWLEGAAHS